MNRNFYLVAVTFFLLFLSCKEKRAYEINLKWNKAYHKDTFERSITGFKWGLTYLGSSLASDSTLIKFNQKDSILHLNIKDLGFSEDAVEILARLQYKFIQSEGYKKSNSYDLGRYMALTFGTPQHYYAITDIEETFKDFNNQYSFSDNQGYINNSTVSKVHRLISFSKISENNLQAFISAEIDSITKDTLEFETAEIMPNGQLKFGIYDADGFRKDAASKTITNAGTPAKCIWCHEVVIQPFYRDQKNFKGYLNQRKLKDTLIYFNSKLQNFQDTLWIDQKLLNKRLHTELELLYIAFMEPSLERISREWNLPLDQTKSILKNLKTHKHHEFTYLGELYHRSEVDSVSPVAVIEVVESIREKSANTVNLLD